MQFLNLDKIQQVYKKDWEKFSNRLNSFIENKEIYSLPKKSSARKDVLFVCATHGNEKIGVEALKEVDSDKFDYMVGNERALEKEERFIDCDLNRSAPGTLSSKKYEERRAVEILTKAQQYNYVVDLHGTIASSGIFIIMTKLSFNDFLLALQFDIPNIVIWLPEEPRGTGPIVQYLEPAIEIESGPKDDPTIKKQLSNSLSSFLAEYENSITTESLAGKNVFWARGKVENYEKTLRDFEKIRIGDDEFYPILVGEYGGSCQKMYKLL